VSAAHEGNQEVIDQAFLADKDLADFLPDSAEDFALRLDLFREIGRVHVN
jgi:hypothetical protein